MKIISRYIIRHFLSIFSIALLSFCCLYFVIDFFGRIDNFLEKKVLWETILSYFLCKIPLIITQSIPMAILVSGKPAFSCGFSFNSFCTGTIRLRYCLTPGFSKKHCQRYRNSLIGSIRIFYHFSNRFIFSIIRNNTSCLRCMDR